MTCKLCAACENEDCVLKYYGNALRYSCKGFKSTKNYQFEIPFDDLS